MQLQIWLQETIEKTALEQNHLKSNNHYIKLNFRSKSKHQRLSPNILGILHYQKSIVNLEKGACDIGFKIYSTKIKPNNLGKECIRFKTNIFMMFKMHKE